MTPARLLVVDDNDMNREVLRRRFGRGGHDIVTAASGEAAMDVIEWQTFDLVLLDIEMPGLSGLDVLRSLRTRFSQVDLPVVMVSARRDSEMVVEALKLGANDYITKPVDFAVARARVDAQLARRRLEPVAPRTHPLTGLPNRLAVDEWFGRRAAPERPVGVVWLNLDRFRAVNNGLGRETGDALLVELAERLRPLTPEAGLLVHLHADDFVLLDADGNVDRAAALASSLLEALRPPVALKDHQILMKGRIGITCAAGRTTDALLAEADAALYRAKTRSSSRWVVFDDGLQSRAAERLRLETELQQALETGAIDVAYQPIIKLSTGAVSGFEVLARWYHPTRGEILPAAFIPVAEETGLIGALGDQVLRRACRQLRQWQDEGVLVPPGGLSVNVSGLQLRDEGWVDSVAAAIAETGVDPRGLKLEITESVLLEDTEHIPAVLERARALGIELALDDFGTGYSSLNYLQQFALNSLKVDRSFVGRLTGPGGGPGVVKAILQLAATFGMEVVAEGIESATELEELQALGCVYGQGFFLSKPLPSADASRLLTVEMPASP